MLAKEPDREEATLSRRRLALIPFRLLAMVAICGFLLGFAGVQSAGLLSLALSITVLLPLAGTFLLLYWRELSERLGAAWLKWATGGSLFLYALLSLVSILWLLQLVILRLNVSTTQPTTLPAAADGFLLAGITAVLFLPYALMLVGSAALSYCYRLRFKRVLARI